MIAGVRIVPTQKLTKRAVDAASSNGRDTFYWDEELRGFGLKVTGAGNKTYVVQYRMGGRGAATRRYTIGGQGAWTPAAARDEAVRLLRLAAAGTDPVTASREKQRVDRELRFDAYAARFLSDYGKREWRPRTFASAESNMRRWVLPVIGRKSLPNIRRRDLTEVFDRLSPDSPALPRNLFALIRKLFVWAVERGDIDQSPMDGMKSPPAVESRDRILGDQELMMIALFAEDLGTPFEQFVRMLVVTGQRRDEVAGMRWSELNRSATLWTIPAARSKNKRVHRFPLNSIAVRALDKIADGEKWPTAGLVFTTTGSTPISGFSKMKKRLDAAIERGRGAPVVPWRLHDLRRTFATNMQRLGVRFEVTEALLNHISGSKAGVAGVYQRHDWTPEKADAVRLWAEKLIMLVNEYSGDGLVRSAGI